MILNSFLDFESKNFLEIGTFQIRWYAICILVGIIFAAILGINEAKRFGISKQKILDGVLICVPLAIVGARLYYVFTSWESIVLPSYNFVQALGAIVGFVDGEWKLEGLAINGGIFVAIAFVIIYCKVRKINVFHVFDLLAPGLLIGQICGRWGNFFNQEAHGPAVTAENGWITNLVPNFIMDRMYFHDYELGITDLWHPTFFYEATWNLIAFVAILVSRRFNKKQRVGDTIAFYLAWYGIGRALIIEPLRMDPLLFVPAMGGDLWYNRVNIVVNLGLAIIGIIWLILKHTAFKQPYYIETQQEIKASKIDGVIFRLDETMVSSNRLIENAYYYTAKDKLGIELSDLDLLKLIEKDPKEYFTDPEALAYYYEYFEKHYSQTQEVLKVKELFKTLYVHDYHVVLVTKHSKEYAMNVLELLKIGTYVSVFIDKEYEDQMASAFDAVRANNILVVSALANDIEYANNNNAQSCFVYFGKEIDKAMELNPKYVITKEEQFNDIIIE